MFRAAAGHGRVDIRLQLRLKEPNLNEIGSQSSIHSPRQFRPRESHLIGFLAWQGMRRYAAKVPAKVAQRRADAHIIAMFDEFEA